MIEELFERIKTVLEKQQVSNKYIKENVLMQFNNYVDDYQFNARFRNKSLISISAFLDTLKSVRYLDMNDYETALVTNDYDEYLEENL